ncbi:MAG: hypothetical protein FD143_3002 [Ignavibacteria bacterium]|nr:MAG: hypothetical protein FD143_3002 [Ignavibacteria bacterium]
MKRNILLTLILGHLVISVNGNLETFLKPNYQKILAKREEGIKYI